MSARRSAEQFTALSVDEIARLLPHRYPFALLDRVTALVPGVRAEAIKNVSAADPITSIVERMHEALRPTRGAAVGLAEIDPGRGRLAFAGVGNIAGSIVADSTFRSVVSHHGTLGHDVRKIQEFSYPWPRGAVLVMHSDGLTSKWGLEAYPGLIQRDPALVAAVLYRDFQRGNDDTTVVVVRGAA